MVWRKYCDLEPVRRLRNEGRELLGKPLFFTEKRDGSNISLWMENGEVKISSHNLEVASDDLVLSVKSTAEYTRAVDLLKDEAAFKKEYVLYGELVQKGFGATRIEPKHKVLRWVIFDIWDVKEERYVPYNLLYQKAYHHKIPVVKVADFCSVSSMEELQNKINESLSWCKRHRREGVVIKDYGDQVFAKEKVDLPKLKKIDRVNNSKVQYPPMPEERVLRALQHAFDAVGEEHWSDRSLAMPEIAKQISTEAREHLFQSPRNLYKIYLETPVPKLKVESSSEP